MGVRGLDTFLRTSVRNGSFEVSIAKECEKFRRRLGGSSRPVIIIDVMGFLSVLCTDKVEMLCGGRHDFYRKRLENFLKKLKTCADLVFFSDGPVIDDKYQTWVGRQTENYEKSIAIIDDIKYGKPLRDVVATDLQNIPRVSTFLSMVETTVRKYGKLVVALTKECDAELVQYANNNPSVIAILAEDSDFLIFSGRWRYWSLMSLNLQTLKTTEKNRTALRDYLQLTDRQLIILSTLAGNDMISHGDVRPYHMSNGWYNCSRKFHAISNIVRNQFPFYVYPFVDQISDLISVPCSVRSFAEIRKQVESSLQQYNTDFKIPNYDFSPLLRFCHKNYCNFTFSVLKHLPKKLKIIYYDLRTERVPVLFEVSTELLRKKFGIVLSHQRRLKLRIEVGTKESQRTPFTRYYLSPVYPKATLPPLLELLDRQNHPEHDKLRFELLKWMINDKKLNVLDISVIPPKYLLVILVLVFMTSNGFISTVEADLILLTIKNVNLGEIPKGIKAPEVVDPRAFAVSFMFAYFYQSMEWAFEVVGMKLLTEILNFDGVYFHKRFMECFAFEFSPKKELADIDEMRLYK